MTETGAEILAEARTREARLEDARRPIDYARMQREHRKQKAALTRATRSGDVDKLVLTIRDTIRVWDEIGAWPDDWSRWQVALDDALPWNGRVDLRSL